MAGLDGDAIHGIERIIDDWTNILLCAEDVVKTTVGGCRSRQYLTRLQLTDSRTPRATNYFRRMAIFPMIS